MGVPFLYRDGVVVAVEVAMKEKTVAVLEEKIAPNCIPVVAPEGGAPVRIHAGAVPYVLAKVTVQEVGPAVPSVTLPA